MEAFLHWLGILSDEAVRLPSSSAPAKKCGGNAPRLLRDVKVAHNPLLFFQIVLCATKHLEEITSCFGVLYSPLDTLGARHE